MFVQVSVQNAYRDNPFHNFRHCFCVSQMLFVMLENSPRLQSVLTKMDFAALLTASGGGLGPVRVQQHDLDHPGKSNSYQVNARTELAVKYDYKSPLENHHKDVTFSILGQPETNIFSQCSRSEVEQIKSVRESA